MTENELKSMTVVQLKQYVKENHITLGAGLDKAAIVAKISRNTGARHARLAKNSAR